MRNASETALRKIKQSKSRQGRQGLSSAWWNGWNGYGRIRSLAFNLYMYSQCPLCLLTQLALLVNITTCGGAMPTPGAPDTPYVKEQVRLNHVWWNQPDAKKADETMAGELSSGNNHLHLNFLIVAIYVMINTTYFVVVQDLHFNPNVRTTRLVCLVKSQVRRPNWIPLPRASGGEVVSQTLGPRTFAKRHLLIRH